MTSEVELHRMVVSNTSEIIGLMTQFFVKSFHSITQLGFDLTQLDTVKSVLSESHLLSLRT